MKTNEIEPGMVFLGPGGQIREVVTIEPGDKGTEVHYRQISRGIRSGRGCVEEGGIGKCLLTRFQIWAEHDVTEYAAKGRRMPQVAQKGCQACDGSRPTRQTDSGANLGLLREGL